MLRLTLLASCLFLGWNVSVMAENWPDFRGPSGQGLYDGKSLPLEWSITKNVIWKKPIPGHGWSSPIVQDGHIYLTTAIPVKDSKDQLLVALGVDESNGEILWQTEIFRQDGAKAPPIHSKNSHASPTPITDGKRLYVHFGHQGSACLDLDGKILWRSTELSYAPVHGNGGTPVLVDDRLVFSADGGDRPFVGALNTADGKVVWKTERNTKASRTFSFSTPLVIRVKGQKQIISPGSDAVMAYDPRDGKEIWRLHYDGYSVIPRPVYGHGMIYLSTGYDRPSLLAIRVDGKGDVTKTHLAWTAKKAAPNTPSPLLVGDELYMVSDGGLVSCLDAHKGKPYWNERISGEYSASPLYADGKIYFQSEQGVTTVIQAGKTFQTLATSKLDERTFASFAVADGSIYLRTEHHLYRIH